MCDSFKKRIFEPRGDIYFDEKVENRGVFKDYAIAGWFKVKIV
jgi:hypothetical protein